MQRKPNCTCATCGKPIYRRPAQLSKFLKSYCSHVCKGQDQSKFIKCAVCDNLIKSRLHRKTCSRKCANKQKEGLRYKGLLGRKPKDKVKDLQAIRKRVIEKCGNACTRCGYNRYPILEVHHIVERSKGGTDDISNLELICPLCHAEEHYLRRLERNGAGVVDLASLERMRALTGSEGSNPSRSSK